MQSKKRKAGLRWWRRKKTLQRLAVVASLAAVVGVFAWLVVQGSGDSEPDAYLTESASPFTLPTVAGEEFSLAEHSGRHNILLYFNEGLG